MAALVNRLKYWGIYCCSPIHLLCRTKNVSLDESNVFLPRYNHPGKFQGILKFSLVLFFIFFLIGCSSSTPKERTEAQWTKNYLIGAYYYLWYPVNWREGYINGHLLPPQLPALGEYDSSDPRTIERHITWASQYGINFWAISWWPDHPELDQIIQKRILSAKNIRDIKFCIFYETAGLGLKDDRITFTPVVEEKLISDFRFLAKTYFSHPSYLKIKGRPVVIIYLTRTFVGNYTEAIKNLRKGLREMGYNPFLIGDEIFWYVMHPSPLPPSPLPETDRIKMFDGITAYNLYNWAKPNQMGYGNQSTFLVDVKKLFQTYRQSLGNQGLLIPAIIPGYNDRGVRLSENHPVIPRQYREGGEEGSFFSQALNQTVVPFINPDIPMALITTFNEWNEGTQIEPTKTNGITRQDDSPSRSDYTQGYAYQGYGEKYLSILQDTFVAVGGRILDDLKKSPLPKVEISAWQEKTLVASTLSDREGYYNLSRINLLPGIYEVKANLMGYQEVSIRVRVEDHKTSVNNFRLSKK